MDSAKARQVYLGKDLSEVTLPDAALLAGLIQSAGGPQSVPAIRTGRKARRNVVLKADARERLHHRAGV